MDGVSGSGGLERDRSSVYGHSSTRRPQSGGNGGGLPAQMNKNLVVSTKDTTSLQ